MHFERRTAIDLLEAGCFRPRSGVALGREGLKVTSQGFECGLIILQIWGHSFVRIDGLRIVGPGCEVFRASLRDLCKLPPGVVCLGATGRAGLMAADAVLLGDAKTLKDW